MASDTGTIRVIYHSRGDKLVLTLNSENHGQLDLTNIEDLRKVMKDAMKDGSATIILNLQRIIYMDSAIIGYLVEVHNALRNKGGGLEFANLSSKVLKIFEITNLIKYFKVYKNIKEVED